MASVDPPLFCPFCRECFEGMERCPDHDLPLVPFEKLPKERRAVGWDQRLELHDPRFGRGIVAFSAILVFVGFAFPMVTSTVSEPVTFSGFEVAAKRAPQLWAVPLVAIGFLVILLRRRTPRQLRGARVAIPLMSVLGATALGYTFMNIQRGAELMGSRLYQEIQIDVEWGTWVVGFGLVGALLGGFRLGSIPTTNELPHGAAPEEGGGIDFSDPEETNSDEPSLEEAGEDVSPYDMNGEPSSDDTSSDDSGSHEVGSHEAGSNDERSQG
ncbi:MAG: hypothetical protein AAGF12_33520 [Myxococcota bacterium]